MRSDRNRVHIEKGGVGEIGAVGHHVVPDIVGGLLVSCGGIKTVLIGVSPSMRRSTEAATFGRIDKSFYAGVSFRPHRLANQPALKVAFSRFRHQRSFDVAKIRTSWVFAKQT